MPAPRLPAPSGRDGERLHVTTEGLSELVNEAWLKLERSPDLGQTTPTHIKWIAARAMRQVLIEAARRRRARKRAGGAEVALVPLEGLVEKHACGAPDVLDLVAALQDLARIEPRHALLVELRYFGGLTVSELAVAFGVSESTVERDWRVARAWLKVHLQRA